MDALEGYIIMAPTNLSSYPATEPVILRQNTTNNKLNTGNDKHTNIALTPGTLMMILI
jgi:hypothetical protein